MKANLNAACLVGADVFYQGRAALRERVVTQLVREGWQGGQLNFEYALDLNLPDQKALVFWGDIAAAREAVKNKYKGMESNGQ